MGVREKKESDRERRVEREGKVRAAKGEMAVRGKEERDRVREVEVRGKKYREWEGDREKETGGGRK